ncbi:EAL domain-containing protein [Magnetovibrio sp. PR-2]|uniref:EAL domain-containing protein n=1 Tax=Magnetovibrio sp. PR-2 TaxID=3120356 RepID=UPI002FCE274A
MGDKTENTSSHPSVAQDGASHAEARGVLRTLSHEMRTPLNNIIGFADMMSAEMLGPMSHPQYRDYAEDIRKSGQSILDLLNELLEDQRYENITESDEHHASLIDLAPDLIAICSIDGALQVLNPAGCAILSVEMDTATLHSIRNFIHPDYTAIVDDEFAALLETKRRTSMKMMAEDGREVDVDVAASVYEEEDGHPTQVMIVARDVTEKNRHYREVIEREEFLRTIMETTVDGLITINEMGVIETANPAAENIFGYDADAMVGANMAELVPSSRGRRQSDSAAAIKNLEHDILESTSGREVTGLRKNGTSFPLEISMSDFKLRHRMHYIAVVRDITERKKNEDKLKFLATRDPLTHLPNRYLFNERLLESAQNSDETGSKLAVLFIDMDNFKHINNAMGHAAGDVVLQLAGKRLESCVRNRDTIARLSGDEFTVILESVNEDEEVEAVATRMLKALSQPFHVDGQELYSSGSIGVIVYPDSCDNVDELLKNVYTASHHAKKQGRNNFQFYSSTLSANALRRMAIEHGLRHALENDEFHLAYQPKVDLSTGRIIGAEALARWTNPDLGPVSPVEFVPVSEETGLIVPIGDWILEKACTEAKQWMDVGLEDVSVAVNLSVRQFRQGTLAERVQEILGSTGLPCTNLDLELTESMLVENAEQTVQVLRELKALGVSLSIDDFGTGYSSLSYLTKFPLDSLKVDRSFVTGLPDNPDAVTMAKAIVNMAQNLGLKIIAEGIETERQSAFLHALGSDVGQGYLFSRPVSYEEFVRLAGGNVTPFPVDQVRKPSA